MLKLEPFFETIVLSSRYFVRKPDPQIYAHALKALRLTPDQALYVGNDPQADVPGPQSLGMPVAVIDRANLYPDLPVPVIKDLREVLDFVRNRY
ncbi:MAG: HAD-IA family hydrolase, partial [Deltaproteobacteria bacterium]|nr:HAD-IA family hydrolase [Deltaproteobacteria bacterium]